MKKTQRPSMSELSRRQSPQERRPQQEKTRPPTSQEVEKNLAESLASTDEGLKAFLASLRQARMPEAVQAYRAMQMVLVQQRLWANEHRREQLLPRFRAIAQTAAEIHRIFSSFADVMKPLKELDKLRAPLVAKPPPKPPPPESSPPEPSPPEPSPPESSPPESSPPCAGSPRSSPGRTP
jgi:hypothetical protein